MDTDLVRLERMLSQIRTGMYVSATLSLIACVGVAVALVFAVRSFGDYATVMRDASTTIEDAQQTSARASLVLDEAESVLQRARATMGATQRTITEAAETTEQAQSVIRNAPTNILRSIPILNWFIPN